MVIIIAVVLTITLKANNMSLATLAANLLGKNDSQEIQTSQIDDEGHDSQNATDEANIESQEAKDVEKEEPTEAENSAETKKPKETEAAKDIYDTITISAAGDVTLGRDASYGYEQSFDQELELQGDDYGYFFRNVKDIFEKDDLTIVNLETVLTTSSTKQDKEFAFKADPSYVEILKQGNVETVNLANNHTYDYLEEGYKETIATLEEADIGHFGNGNRYITEIRGIKIGVIGYKGWYESDEVKQSIKTAIEELRAEDADLVIAMFHWGIERDHYPNSAQRNLAHFTIDSGADLILGSHPHVLQGIEEYNGKNIVYSLGNFAYGGHRNPADKDTMVYVHKFHFKNGDYITEESEVIPCSISSVKERNNFQPTVLEGEEKERVMARIVEFSQGIK